MSSKLPCHNCITLPICLVRFKKNPSLLPLINKCSLLVKYLSLGKLTKPPRSSACGYYKNSCINKVHKFFVSRIDPNAN